MNRSNSIVFVGLDLTSAYSARPRPIDVAILDEGLHCVFTRVVWPSPDLVRERVVGAAKQMLESVFSSPPQSDIVWAVDGPQGLARAGRSMRECERALSAPGKTSHTLPSDGPGGKPFETYVRSSVDLFAALAGWDECVLVGLNSVPAERATLFEVYPGAEWKVLAGRNLPKKDTPEGLDLRRQVLLAAGLSGLPGGITHDQADAAVGALVAWATRHSLDAVSMVGEAPYVEDGVLREGYIAHFSQSLCNGNVRPSVSAGASRQGNLDRSSGARSLDLLKQHLAAFARERDWEQFHTPKNLSMALSVEVAELVEHFQWLTVEQSQQLDKATLGKVREEIGDVMIYLVRLSDKLDVDLLDAAFAKLRQNERKYPADRVRGKAKKYSEY